MYIVEEMDLAFKVFGKHRKITFVNPVVRNKYKVSTMFPFFNMVVTREKTIVQRFEYVVFHSVYCFRIRVT